MGIAIGLGLVLMFVIIYILVYTIKTSESYKKLKRLDLPSDWYNVVEPYKGDGSGPIKILYVGPKDKCEELIKQRPDCWMHPVQ